MAHNLIASDRVEGTAVCQPDGKRIGRIERLMIDKLSGRIAYAVLTFGGFLGVGEKHFPVPWSALKYNLAAEAYELDLDQEQLRQAPAYQAGEEFDWGERSQTLVRARYPTHTGWE
jgi:sporulation protein YlmC with PRC-barrel domain